MKTCAYSVNCVTLNYTSLTPTAETIYLKINVSKEEILVYCIYNLLEWFFCCCFARFVTKIMGMEEVNTLGNRKDNEFFKLWK